jgi:multiple sugar transport system permease protein
MMHAVALRQAASPPRLSRRERARRRFGFSVTVPALAVYAVLILYPFLSSVRLAFYRSTLIAPEPVFVGLANFQRLAQDPSFLWSWLRTILFVVLTTGLSVLVGLAWAIVLNQAFRGARLLRSLSLVPWVMPSAVTALLWAWLLNGQYGVLNAYLMRVGLIDESIAWLATDTGAMVGIVFAKTWLSTALVMTFFLASLQTLPLDQVEAARLDGASNRQVIRYVVLPHLRHTLLVITVLQAMGNLQQIDVIYAMTGGGPAGATSVMSIEVYKAAFQSWNLGRASAIGVVWFLTISIPASIYLRSLFRV